MLNRKALRLIICERLSWLELGAPIKICNDLFTFPDHIPIPIVIHAAYQLVILYKENFSYETESDPDYSPSCKVQEWDRNRNPDLWM